MRLNTLLPEPGELETDELAAILELAERAPADRPYLIANMVSSADGRATLAGRSGRMGGEGDRELFQALRTCVDAVLAGTATARVERYGRLVRDPAHRARRAAAGLEPDPLAVLMTRRGDVPWEAPLFAAGEQRVAICTGAELRPPEGVAAQVEVIPVRNGDDAAAAGLRALRTRHGVRSVLCEGGPLLLRGLLDGGRGRRAVPHRGARRGRAGRACAARRPGASRPGRTAASLAAGKGWQPVRTLRRAPGCRVTLPPVRRRVPLTLT